MKKNLIFNMLLAIIGLSANAQMLKKQPHVVEKTQETITAPAIYRLPDRGKLIPASKDLWNPMPQFEVDIEKEKQIHWYALEKSDDSIYWSGVKLNKILNYQICI